MDDDSVNCVEGYKGKGEGKSKQKDKGVWWLDSVATLCSRKRGIEAQRQRKEQRKKPKAKQKGKG